MLYISVKLALTVLFRKLDYLCAVRTAQYHSYRNPVERIMSILNLGLQVWEDSVKTHCIVVCRFQVFCSPIS